MVKAFMSTRQAYRTTLPGNVAEYRVTSGYCGPSTASLWPKPEHAAEDALTEASRILAETEPLRRPDGGMVHSHGNDTPVYDYRRCTLACNHATCLAFDAVSESIAAFVAE